MPVAVVVSFRDNAADWDSRPVPQQISEGVFRAISEAVAFDARHTVMDFGAALGAMITDAGFAGVAFTTACEVSKEA